MVHPSAREAAPPAAALSTWHFAMDLAGGEAAAVEVDPLPVMPAPKK
tara:strand:- start:849 stop:989 length:141 start_codon:yes stop_codon:yes gene_type:complete